MRSPRRWICGDIRPNTVYLVNEIRRHYFVRRARRHNAPFTKHIKSVAIVRRQVQVVQRGKCGDAQFTHDVQDFQLVANVKMVGGFVQHQKLRLLRQRAR